MQNVHCKGNFKVYLILNSCLSDVATFQALNARSHLALL